ncbi:hypothetical protein NFI96_003444 [Prochilodus magdalenae]|nr:hypothetical protein NFI96_003444 [Prochilodus magdalenae]
MCSLGGDITVCPTPLPPVTSPPTEYLIEIEIDTVDVAVLNQLRTLLKRFSLPFRMGDIEITELNITTVCLLNGTGYQCRCEDQYFWPCDKCTAYGHCDDIISTPCGCIKGYPSDGQFCQPITELRNITVCPTPLPPVTSPPTEYLIEIEIDTVDVAVLNQLRTLLKRFSLPFRMGDIEITELNITTVCLLNGTGYQCRCEDQYFWPCDKCTAYGHCDDIISTPCGCIKGYPSDGQFCQPITELRNITVCPTPLPPVTSPPTEYLIEIEIDTVDVAVLNQLRTLLKRFSLPFRMGDIEITELNITTVCLLNGTGYQCRCEDQYFWPCDKCTVYGHCDDIISTTCGCIKGYPSDGQFCQPITELRNITVCPTPFPPDVDECLLVQSVCGPNSTCTNTIGGYSCSCWEGFTATNSSLPVGSSNPCIDVDECLSASSVCGFNSTCTNTIGGYKCTCWHGFTATYSNLTVNITNSCIDVDECLLVQSVCGPNSTCTNTIGGYSCSCWEGFTATNSSLPVGSSNPCIDVDECLSASSVCGFNSTCTNTIGGYKCTCWHGFTATYSNLTVNITNSCIDVDECLLVQSVCGPNSTCTNTVGGYSCSCWEGFTATNSSLPVGSSNPCIDVDECLSASSVCGFNSTCTNTIGGYNCTCWHGFTATYSNLTVNITNPCIDVDECLYASSVCGLNSTCTNTIGGYSCSCWNGFTAINSDLTLNITNPCIDVNECLSAPSVCGLNSTCTNTIGGYSCSCWDGYNAANSSLTVNIANPCIDVDECLSAPSVCGSNSTCTNTVGGYSCSCWTGFTAANSSLNISASNPCTVLQKSIAENTVRGLTVQS